MKLVFSKNEKQEIVVQSKVGDETFDFSYVNMIKSLIDSRALEATEIDENFSDAEKESILKMVNHINKEVEEFYAED